MVQLFIVNWLRAWSFQCAAWLWMISLPYKPLRPQVFIIGHKKKVHIMCHLRRTFSHDRVKMNSWNKSTAWIKRESSTHALIIPAVDLFHIFRPDIPDLRGKMKNIEAYMYRKYINGVFSLWCKIVFASIAHRYVCEHWKSICVCCSLYMYM